MTFEKMERFIDHGGKKAYGLHSVLLRFHHSVNVTDFNYSVLQ